MTTPKTSTAADAFYADPVAMKLMNRLIAIETADSYPAVVLNGDSVEVERKYQSASVVELKEQTEVELRKIWNKIQAQYKHQPHENLLTNHLHRSHGRMVRDDGSRQPQQKPRGLQAGGRGMNIRYGLANFLMGFGLGVALGWRTDHVLYAVSAFALVIAACIVKRKA